MAERLPYTEHSEPTKFGEAFTIVGRHFAPPTSNDNLLDMALGYGLPIHDIEGVKKAIEATGFKYRYFSHKPEEKPDPEKSLERTADIGAFLLNQLLRSKGWEDGIDLFIDTSAFLPTTINEKVLAKAGLDSRNIISKSYRYACAGAVGAIIDVLSDPDYKNARVVVAALEPLSQLLDTEQFLSPNTVSFPSIFGDAYSLIAIDPSRFTLFNKDVLIQPDGGVIRLQTQYKFESISAGGKIPGHYRFTNGGEKIFKYSDKGAFLDIEKPVSGRVSMDGMATGFFFGDQTTEVITRLVDDYGDVNLLKSLDGKNIIMHAASKPVVDRIAKLLRRHPNRYLDTPYLPFLMDTAKFSNGSSATTLNRLRYMTENNMLDPNLPMFWIAPGIGSAIAGAIGAINP